MWCICRTYLLKRTLLKTCLNNLNLNWDMVWQFLRELGRGFQDGITVSVKEDEYCEVIWEGIDKTGSRRERVMRSWYEDSKWNRVERLVAAGVLRIWYRKTREWMYRRSCNRNQPSAAFQMGGVIFTYLFILFNLTELRPSGLLFHSARENTRE